MDLVRSRGAGVADDELDALGLLVSRSLVLSWAAAEVVTCRDRDRLTDRHHGSHRQE